MFAMGCFWGPERLFASIDGVVSTAVGYSGGTTEAPTYEAVCNGYTGHAEAILVEFDPQVVTYEDLLKVFWENHDPTQGMRQGNDIGSQYRSVIFTFDVEQRSAAEATRDLYQEVLSAAGLGAITTEIVDAPKFFRAEEYHQRYLERVPGGYCGHGGTGVRFPIHETGGGQLRP